MTSIQRVTILGQRITLVRPSVPYRSKVYKNERPTAKINKRPRTRQFGCAEFFKLCMEYNEKLKGGEFNGK